METWELHDFLKVKAFDEKNRLKSNNDTDMICDSVKAVVSRTQKGSKATPTFLRSW